MKTYLGLLLYVLGLAAGCARDSTTATSVPVAPPAVKAEPFPIPVVEMRGDGSDLGLQHAKDLQPVIHMLHEQYLRTIFSNEDIHQRALIGAAAFEPHVLPRHLEEIRSLAKGTELDEREVMLANCFLDLLPMVACSTITLPAAASPDGVARFGRNLDFPSLNVADKNSVVMIYHPKDRYSFAAVSWPGLVGVLSGMNEHGLALCNMEVTRPFRLPRAMPYTLLYRTVLEQCKTVDEAIELLKKTDRQTSNNVMLMDASGARAVAEISPDAVNVRKADDQTALISTNHQRSTGNGDRAGRCDRYDYLHDESAKVFGKIDQAELQRMLGHVAQREMTLQSMIFEPANRLLWLAVGSNAPNTQTFHRLDLKEHFAH